MPDHSIFADKLKAKAVIVAFGSYVVLATVAFAIVVQVWIPAGVPAASLAELAESDPTLRLWQQILGVTFALAAGYLASRLSGRAGLRNSLVVGGLLVLYGVLSVFLHPHDPISWQVGKLLTPIPVTLIGGWLCLRLAPPVKA